MIEYVSTRGQAPRLGFEDVLLTGLARDGGLYVPERWPEIDTATLESWRGRPYAEVAAALLWPFVEGSLERGAFSRMVGEAAQSFAHQAVAPLTQIDETSFLLELFHGPTLAFKDVALQLVGRLFEHVLARRGGHLTIIGATSGDTGSAAIEAVRGRERMNIFILHPEGRVSEVQRRQMTTVEDANVFNIAVRGTFDDCQDLVKALFNDEAFRDEVSLSGVNSINWARIMPQIVYYVTAALALGAPARRVAFSVPTGNFGDIYAGYAAQRMGLPIERLMIATNRNDILARALATGDYRRARVEPTLSPSMDIQVSSNFERLLFDAHGRDAEVVRTLMEDLKREGGFAISQNALAWIRERFEAARVDGAATLETMAELRAHAGELIDPHTAVGLRAAREMDLPRDVARIVLATAHPAKFPDAVEKATGERPSLPAHLGDLFVREERMEVMDNRLDAIRTFIRERII